MRFCVPTLSEEVAKFFDLLLETEGIADVRTGTEEEKILKRLAFNIGESLREATAVLNDRDVIFEYQDISWTPIIGCMEVSGGLPRLGTPRLMAGCYGKLAGVNANEIFWWGLTVVGKVYALASAGGLFHLVLVYECLLPNSQEDLVNLEHAYLVLKEYKKKLDETKDILCKLNQERTKLITRGKKRGSDEMLREVRKKPEIINMLEQRKRSR
ncbi:hypothetical protein C1646_760202 [Rhizophagus diaphanus]|nr:hypothetical protein C1646_760202 [Rhizophagus diaphanus] [Rhizophagus sp. MUCL 43196]